MRFTMIGHSTVLIEVAELRILTDPYFGRRGNLAYRRLAPPAKSRKQLADVDLVLLSHLHWDHVDRTFLKSLPATTPVVVPAGTGWLARLHGARLVVPLRRWEQLDVGSSSVTATPASHLATTAGFVLRAPGTVAYFAGDTYHRPFMKEIRARFHPEIALMPVSTYRIPMTMGERGAMCAARDLGVATVIPIHLGLTPRSPLLRGKQSPDGFVRRVQEAGLGLKVISLREGESWFDAASWREREHRTTTAAPQASRSSTDCDRARYPDHVDNDCADLR